MKRRSTLRWSAYTNSLARYGRSNFASILGPLGERLHRWTKSGSQGAGQFGYLFDNVEDTLTFCRFQTFNFDSWGDYPDILEPLLFYVLQRASSEIEKPENTGIFKVFLIDRPRCHRRNGGGDHQ